MSVAVATQRPMRHARPRTNATSSVPLATANPDVRLRLGSAASFGI